MMGAAGGGIIVLLVKKKIEERSTFQFTLEKFSEGKNMLIRIQNQGPPLEGCTIICEKTACTWWDNSGTKPRNIHSGGGANVILPEISGFSNPTITVKRYNKTLKKVKLYDIVQAQQ